MELLKFKKLDLFDNLQHGIVTRVGGCSSGNYKSLNFSYNSGDAIGNVDKNRAKLAEVLQISVSDLHFPDQCHTTNVQWVSGNCSTFKETDALITKSRNIAIAVLSADCVPILFYDRKKEVIAAAHAGWRGTVNGVVGNVIAEMVNAGGCLPKDIIVAIGPSIQQVNYEVGEEVADAVKSINIADVNSILLSSKKKGHWLLNLPELNKQILLGEGVLECHIETMKLCTFDNEDLFFSARRDGFHCGRFGAVIMLK